MAIDYKQFTEQINTGIKSTKDYQKFIFMYWIDGKRKTKSVNYTKKKGWPKKDCIKQARREYDKFVEIVNTASGGNITEETKLNTVAEQYFKYERKQTKWTAELKQIYKLYIEPSKLGNLPVKDITLNRINQLKVAMLEGTISASKKTKNKGSSNTSVNKVIVQCLIPVLKYAKNNGAIQNVPEFKKLEQSSKKKVTNAKDKIQTLYAEIMSRYSDQPYYRAMFLFVLYGRRWNEIATLHTDDVDFEKQTYTIRAENSKTNKTITYTLPIDIAIALQELAPDKGLVFYVGGKKVWTPKKQLAKIKEATGIPELTMHYFRHILATSLLEQGSNVAVASAMLGHSNTETTNRHYATLDTAKHTEKGVGQITEIIDNES